MSEALFELGNGYLVLARKAADGRMVVAGFLLDVYCVGVNDVILRVGEASEIEPFVEALGTVDPMVAIDPGRARKLLRDLVAWSRSIGLAPHPDYAAAEPLFGDVLADPSDESFRFGKDGQPFLILARATLPPVSGSRSRRCDAPSATADSTIFRGTRTATASVGRTSTTMTIST